MWDYSTLLISWFINSNLEILVYTVFRGKLQKLHLFKNGRPKMFYFENFAKFTGTLLCRSLIHDNVPGCCSCFLSGIYKRWNSYPCSGISFIKLISFLFSFAVLWSCLWAFYIVFTLWCCYIRSVFRTLPTPTMELFAKIVNSLKQLFLPKKLFLRYLTGFWILLWI